MSVVRAFVAIESSGGVASRAAALITKLRAADAKVTWVAADNMHWTLKFLGDVNLTATAEICSVLQEAVTGLPAFDVQVVGLNAFPNNDRPRTIWLGVTEGEEIMAELAETIDRRLAALGYKPEGRRFRPHLTLGRVRGVQNIEVLSELLKAHADYVAGPMEIDEVSLYTSYLERQGPRYEALCRAVLNG
jgi:RNA 2',3'-cyclic 3'-phosphodiesterase